MKLAPQRTPEIADAMRSTQEANDAWSDLKSAGSSMNCDQKMERLAVGMFFA